MTMKKLYAKTSFTSKKSNAAQLKNASPQSQIHSQSQAHDAPILAYQMGPNDMCEFQAPVKRSQSLYHKPAPRAAPPSDYYSIEELQELDLLDYRHPMYHHYQQQELLLRQRAYHEHEQLVLQLPKASQSEATSPTQPIYETPATTPRQQQQQQQLLKLPSVNEQTLYVATPSKTGRANGLGVALDSASSSASSSSSSTSSAVATTTTPTCSAPNLATTTIASSSNSSNSVPSSISSSAALFSTLRNCVPLPSSFSSTSSTSTTTSSSSAVGISAREVASQGRPGRSPARLACSTSFSIRTPQTHLYSNIHHYLLLQQSQQQSQQQQQQQQHLQHLQQQHSHRPPQRRHNSVKDKFIAGITTIFAEQSIIGARASVMVYDDNQKKWVPSGSSSGLSKVQIYHHQQNNTFRVVGRKLQDHEVVINCSILKGLKYNQATATFHQWRDSKFVYGLNFSSQNDAEAFARAMMHALEVLCGRVANNPIGNGQPTNGNGYEEDMGYRTMTSEDAAILRQNNTISGHITPSAQTPTSQTNQNNIPQSPPTPQGHHRTSRNSLSAPPAPQPQQQQQQQQGAGPQPPHYGPPTGNGPTANGLPPQGNPQMPPAPGPPPQQLQQQYQQQQQQQQQQQNAAVYAAQQQQLVQAGYAPSQYQQPHYVLSSSNPNLNLHQYPPQQLAGPPQPPMPPALQNGGPIYVAAQPGIPSSASANSVVYASQQQMGGGLPPQPPQPPALPASVYGQHNGGQPQPENPYGQVPLAPPMMQQQQQPGVPMPPPLNRMSSTGAPGPPGACAAPAPPPPPPNFGGAPPAPPQQMFNGAPPPPQPPAPPAPPAMGPMGGPGAPPPPPPPPGMGAGGAGGKGDPQADLMGSLAAQLQQFKLKKKNSTSAPPENSGSSTSSGGSGNYGTIGRSSNGMASMMDEMAKTLARRRAQAEKKEPDPEPEVKQRPWEKSNTLPHKLSGGGASGNAIAANGNGNGSASGGNTTNSGGESPRPMRKRFGSASEETILKVNGDGLSLALSNNDLDTLKAEIVREMRLEIQKVKQEIIDAIKSEFNRR